VRTFFGLFYEVYVDGGGGLEHNINISYSRYSLNYQVGPVSIGRTYNH
jgi:hypothetical protein